MMRDPFMKPPTVYHAGLFRGSLGSAIYIKRRLSGEMRPLLPGAIGVQLSSDGARAAFYLFGGLGPDFREIYVYDWATLQYRFAGASPGFTPNDRICFSRGFPAGFPPRNMQQRIALSGDGRTLVFPSLASNLVPGDETDSCDLFARSLDPVPRLLDAHAVPGPGSRAPVLWLLVGLIGLLGTLALRRSG